MSVPTSLSAVARMEDTKTGDFAERELYVSIAVAREECTDGTTNPLASFEMTRIVISSSTKTDGVTIVSPQNFLVLLLHLIALSSLREKIVEDVMVKVRDYNDVIRFRETVNIVDLLAPRRRYAFIHSELGVSDGVYCALENVIQKIKNTHLDSRELKEHQEREKRHAEKAC